MGLSVTVLGSSGSYPGPTAACSGYLLRTGSTTVWLDAGSGTLSNLQRHVRLHDVDAVVLSHEHPDHWSDVEGYYVACAYVLRRDGIPVYAPPTIRPLLAMDPGSTFDWREIHDGSRVEVGDLRLTFCRTVHTDETLAVRVDATDGAALGYSADTSPAWSLEALGPGLDLALCEATFLQEDEGRSQHLSARQAGLTAKAAGVRRLVITHIWPTIDPAASRAEAEAAFDGPVAVAYDHARYDVAPSEVTA